MNRPSLPSLPSTTPPAAPRTAAPRWAALLGAGLAAAIAACDPFQTSDGGGSSDTDNAIALSGEVLGSGGGPAAGIDVLVRRQDYLSPLPRFGKRSAADDTPLVDRADLVTDDLGRFRGDSLDTGSYFLEAVDRDSLAALFSASASRRGQAVTLAPRALSPMAAVEGVVRFRAGTRRVFVQAYGLERLVPVDMATGRYRMRLPEGAYILRVVDPDKARAFARTREVAVVSGGSRTLDTVVLGDSTEPYFAWRHSAEILLNTTPDGGDTRADLHGFPLLVRLDEGNFDFSRALPGGADIRFSKPDGRSPLPHEIERWDAAARRAEIWVRMDTVKADSRGQGLYMYWGNPDAQDASDGYAVFDAAADMAGVWHLGDVPDTAAGGYRDATGNANHGTGAAVGDTSSVEGAIGKALRLDGRSQFVRVPDAPSLRLGTKAFTLSAWVWLDSASGKQQIVSKRVEPGANYELQVNAEGRVAAFPGGAVNGAEGFRSKAVLGPGAWRHVAFAREDRRVVLYVDGVQDAVQELAGIDVGSAGELHIGQDVHLSGERWRGRLDEVRVATRAHQADWIRLSYRTQVPGGSALTWRRLP